MRTVHLQNFDLNLLTALHALLEERHVTRAAERCHLSQPAMSRALERLRDAVGDALLVRTGRTYERTVRGERLFRELDSLLPRLEAMVAGEGFDPSKTRERFRLALTDHASAIILPALMRAMRSRAPGAKVETSPWRDPMYAEVAAGKIETALSAEAPPPMLESEVVCTLDFLCLVGDRQRLRNTRLTLEQYLRLPHVLVETLEGQQTMVDRPLAQIGAKRNVALSIPFFVPAILAIAHTDLVVTVPRKLGNLFKSKDGIRIAQPPKEIGPFPYFMTWHGRLNDEPSQVWFREQVRTAAKVI